MQKQDPSAFPTKSTSFFGKLNPLNSNSSTKETDIESTRSESMKGVNIDMSDNAGSTRQSKGGVMSFFQKK